MFDFDFLKLLKWLIPFQIRKPKLLAFFRSLLSHLKTIYISFLKKIVESADHIRITGQVRILRYELNKKFDNVLTRIEILDADIDSVLWLFLSTENQPVYLPQYISGVEYDFVVRIPQELEDQEPFIKAFLNTYKLIGKRYQIEYF